MLRHANHPMMAREIVARPAARYQMVAGNMDVINALVAKVRNTLARQEGFVSEVRGDAKPWRVEARAARSRRSEAGAGRDGRSPEKLDRARAGTIPLDRLFSWRSLRPQISDGVC
jgi:hypothetical protein